MFQTSVWLKRLSPKAFPKPKRKCNWVLADFMFYLRKTFLFLGFLWIFSNFGFSTKPHMEKRPPFLPRGSKKRLGLDFPREMMAKHGISDPFTAAAASRGSGSTGFWTSLFGAFDTNLTHASDFRRRRLLGFNGRVFFYKHWAWTWPSPTFAPNIASQKPHQCW